MLEFVLGTMVGCIIGVALAAILSANRDDS